MLVDVGEGAALVSLVGVGAAEVVVSAAGTAALVLLLVAPTCGTLTASVAVALVAPGAVAAALVAVAELAAGTAESAAGVCCAAEAAAAAVVVVSQVPRRPHRNWRASRRAGAARERAVDRGRGRAEAERGRTARSERATTVRCRAMAVRLSARAVGSNAGTCREAGERREQETAERRTTANSTSRAAPVRERSQTVRAQSAQLPGCAYARTPSARAASETIRRTCSFRASEVSTTASRSPFQALSSSRKLSRLLRGRHTSDRRRTSPCGASPRLRRSRRSRSSFSFAPLLRLRPPLRAWRPRPSTGQERPRPSTGRRCAWCQTRRRACSGGRLRRP